MKLTQDHVRRLTLREDGTPLSYHPHPTYSRILDTTPGQGGFPWGTVVSRKTVCGVEIIKSVDHMRPGRFTWHTERRGFDNEPDAVLHAVMVAKGISVNQIGTAIQMINGLVPEEERDRREVG